MLTVLKKSQSKNEKRVDLLNEVPIMRRSPGRGAAQTAWNLKGVRRGSRKDLMD